MDAKTLRHYFVSIGLTISFFVGLSVGGIIIGIQRFGRYILLGSVVVAGILAFFSRILR